MEQQIIANGELQNEPQTAVQYVYLDFDGELTSYNGEILTVDNVEVLDSSLTEERIANIVAELNTQYADQNVVFVTERLETTEYSTIYIGKTSAFSPYGNFTGLAETIDENNRIKNDNAFVILDSSASDEAIISTVAHETGHLLGMQHEEIRGDLSDYAYTEKEGSGDWNDTPATADYLGRIGSTITVEGRLQSRWYEADQDWYYFIPTTNWLKWSVSTVGLVNTRTIVLFPPTGSGIVLANEMTHSKSGILQVVPGERYYIHCTDSFSGLGPYRFTLSGLNSPGASYTKNFADLTFYKPKGWGAKLVCYPDNAQPNKQLYADINTYLKFSVSNMGKTNAESTTAYVYVDNKFVEEIHISAIQPQYYQSIDDIDLGILSAGKHKITVKVDPSNSILEKNEKNNTVSRTITVKKAPLPDLQFYKPKGWKSSAIVRSAAGKKFYADEDIFLDFSFRNKALRSANASYVYIYVDGLFQKSIQIDELKANYYQTKTNISLGKLSRGKHKITITLDASGRVSEASEKNNTISRTITVNKTPLPDLKFQKPKDWKERVSVFSLSGKKFYSDENIYINFAVFNDSLRRSDASTVGIYIDNVHYRDVDLTAINSNTYSLMRNICIGKLSKGKHKITLRLDDDYDVNEKNEKNNSFSKTITVKQGSGMSLYSSAAEKLSSDGTVTSQLDSGDDFMHGGGDDIFSFGDDWGNDTAEQPEDGSAALRFDEGSENNWDAAALIYSDDANTLKVSEADTLTLDFGADVSLSDGCFTDAASEKIFEDKNSGMLA